MEHICARCARLGPRPRTTAPSIRLANIKTFSSSRLSSDEGDQKPSSSSPARGRPFAGASLRGALNRNATSSPAARSAQPRPGGMLLRRTGGQGTQNATGTETRARASTGAETGSKASPAAGAAARTGSAAGSRGPAPGRLLQRTGAARPGQVQQGQLLIRRTGPGQGQGQGQNQAQRPPFRRDAQGQGQSNSQTPASAPTGKRTDRRVRRLAEQTASQEAEDDDPSSFTSMDLPTRVDQYINTIVDPPANPTTELPHTPGVSLTTTELRKDWPNTPLSNSGLVESVQQRIEWLAHRLPHGYQTPRQLAYHYTRGYLTRFESESEKEEVLKIAHELAQQWADKKTERSEKGEAFEPENMEFEDVVSREWERNGLAETWVKGVYPDVKKQKMPFLDQIVRNLNNNATVTQGKIDQFMQTVQSVIVSRQQQQGGGQVQKRAEK